MDQDSNSSVERGVAGGRLSLRTLLSLRWLAILGQAATIFIVYGALGFQIPLTACLTTIAASAWFNLGLTLSMGSQRQLSSAAGALQLGFDLIQLTILLALTGGIHNPFAILLIVPPTVAAATLSVAWSLGIVNLGLLAVVVLNFWSFPLPWPNDGDGAHSGLESLGIGLAIIVTLLFSAIAAWRIAEEENRVGRALVATQAILSREQNLAAVGGLAAAAAHELGTPLATIQLTSKELMRNLPLGTDKEDAQLIFEQSQRCREILRHLTKARQFSDPIADESTLGALLKEAVETHVHAPPDKSLSFVASEKGGEDLPVPRLPELLYGFGNLIENGLQFAASNVTIFYGKERSSIFVDVVDDGPGFDVDIIQRLGEPYLTTRGTGTKRADRREGMGLGVFIAKTMIERTGGKMFFANRAAPMRGAIVRVEWPQGKISKTI